MLSDRIISAYLNMDVIGYIIAPFYPYTLAFFKWISASHWEIIAVAFQFILIAFSAVYIYKICLLLFSDHKPALLAGVVYILYPFTLWFNYTLTQETSFQAYFIFFIYFFLLAQKSVKIQNTLIAATWFAIAMLTKSHILILLPFLTLLLAYSADKKNGIAFLLMIMALTLPHGLLNKKMHGVYTISSHGNGTFFLLGHSENTYDCLLNRAGKMGSFSADGCDPAFVFDTAYTDSKFGKINQHSPSERNRIKWLMAKDWIIENPGKFAVLKLNGLKRFILPGLDRRQYKPEFWIPSMLLGMILYLAAFWTLITQFWRKPENHCLLIIIYASCAVIFIGFFPVHRFRVITLEPLLICYASFALFGLSQKIKMLLQNH